MKMDIKHKSKLHLGFEKQVIRQRNKPEKVKITLPISVKLPNNFKGKYKHSITVHNSQWNGMNLKNICNSFYINRVGGMYGKFSINADGKYILSRYGKGLLRKRKLKNIKS